jgi:hypothetical protein
MEAHFEPTIGRWASNLRDAVDSLLMLIAKRSHSQTGPAKVCDGECEPVDLAGPSRLLSDV